MSEESIFMHNLAREIAEHLDGWTYQPGIKGVRDAMISMPDGATIIISINWKDKTKLSIAGRYPTHKGYLYPSHVQGCNDDIKVSIDKSPEQIAKDITRRLLPQYLEQYHRGLEMVRRFQKDDEKRLQSLHELQKLLPVLAMATNGAASYLRAYTDTYNCEISVRNCGESDDQVADIKINRLPFEIAKEIVKVLGSHNPCQQESAAMQTERQQNG